MQGRNELGVHSYVDKPVTMDKLKNTLEKIDEELKKRPNKNRCRT